MLLLERGLGGFRLAEAADAVWFEDAFATADGRQADYPGTLDPQVVGVLPNATGVGGGYTWSAWANSHAMDGYVLLGANEGKGLAAKFAKVQTTNSWRLADVPTGMVLRFEMQGVAVGAARRSEANEGFGLSDGGAVVAHARPLHSIIWTFYRPGQRPGAVRPYVQWPGNPYSGETSKLAVPLSTDPYQPDDLAIEFEPAKGTIAFLHNGDVVYVFSNPEGIAALSRVPLPIVFSIGTDNIKTLSLAGWRLSVTSRDGAQAGPDIKK
ncbi:MAG: hypothetical protein PHR35_14155 [Kiritimatiellae bacterium]|nr:hypothetical protein [Kiritimatiellia bacterium]